MAEDYYGVLGVRQEATQDEIKRAYRELALKLHPDRNSSKEATEQFKKVNEAYAVLSDPQKRQQYDTLGSDQFNQRFSPEDIFRGFDFESIFRDMGIDTEFGFPGMGDLFGFGGTGQRQRQARRERGQDLLYRIDVGLEDVAKGAQKEIRIKHIKKCGSCNGIGAEKGYKLTTCSKCRGSGYINLIQRSIFGRIQTLTTCDICGGSGRVPERKCSVCKGRGGIVVQDSIKVDVPHGIREGMRLRLSGMGDYGRDEAGDLYIDVNVLKHDTFERKDDDILTSISIPFYDAILGTEVSVPTLNGKKKVRTEPGTQPNSNIVLKGEGIMGFRSNVSGNEIVNIKVEMPKGISESERELIRKFKDLKEGKDFRKKFGFGLI